MYASTGNFSARNIGIGRTFQSHQATWHTFSRIRQNETGSHIEKGNCLDRRGSKRTRSILQTAMLLFSMLRSSVLPLKETGYWGWFRRGVVQWLSTPICVRSVAHELCHLNLISKLITTDKISLGANYHVSCLTALVHRARQPMLYRRPVSSVGRASDYRAGGLRSEPQTGPTLRVLK